ncbi:MAG TPA: DedA family protein [Prolixibacteraceae bacterium]|jgi:membrane protein DedA with SNARE-associated domain
MGALFQQVLGWYMGHITYWTVFLLMAVESTFVPFPSELVIPPAAYKAANGDMNIFLVVFAGSMGAIAGSLFNYYLAKWLGRSLLLKFVNTRLAHLMMIDQSAIEKTEKYFVEHGKTSTLIGRLIPGIRHLISIPAGLANMKIRDFILFTAIGATAWNVILAMLGYFFSTQQDVFEKYYKELIFIIVAIGGLYVLYLIYKGVTKKKTAV